MKKRERRRKRKRRKIKGGSKWGGMCTGLVAGWTPWRNCTKRPPWGGRHVSPSPHGQEEGVGAVAEEPGARVWEDVTVLKEFIGSISTNTPRQMAPRRPGAALDLSCLDTRTHGW